MSSGPVHLKRSSVANKVPTLDQIDFGELAVNTADGKLYMKFDRGTGPVIEEVGVYTLTSKVGALQVQQDALSTKVKSTLERWNAPMELDPVSQIITSESPFNLGSTRLYVGGVRQTLNQDYTETDNKTLTLITKISDAQFNAGILITLDYQYTEV